MLEKLYIKNYLIIKEATLILKYGLNILTGETGAGKSIILDALSLLLGERADYSIIKKEGDKLIVEGIFNFTGKKKILEYIKKKDLTNESYEELVIIRRELTKKGISRCFINDTPVLISELKEFGDLIIDIHSQNEHQSLLKSETHISILNDYINNEKLIEDYEKSFIEYKKLIEKYIEFENKKNELAEKRSFIDFQLKEINNVNPLPDEDVNIENELKKLENTEEISENITASINYLKESDNNALSNISLSIKELRKVVKYDSNLEKLLEDIESSYTVLKEAAYTLENYKNDLNFDFEKTESLRERYGQINFLKKKYNLSANELIKKAEELKQELNFADNFDEELDILNKKIETEKINVFDKALALSEQRVKSALELSKTINKYLKEAGLENADLKISVKRKYSDNQNNFTFKEKNKFISFNINGIDDVEFLIITNKGEEYQPLKKIASGGEVSRVMLAIKASLTGKDNIPILVFDEIDTGISGRIAGKVGKLIKELSKTHQIISITHLPQIASFSDNHLNVSKTEKNGETIANIKNLNEEEKTLEIAKLLSGEKVTEISIKGAKELINNK